jgi:transcriptional regulator with XRE-family HTH domain
MGTWETARARGIRRARSLAHSIGQELLEARLVLGLSQEMVARAAGLHQSRVSRTERGALPLPRIDELARHCAVLGHELSARPFPVGSPVRDAAQRDLLTGMESLVSDSFRWRFEVGVDIPGDKRAWDAWLDGPGDVAIDAETRLRDIQALQRRLELKWRDSGSPRLVLVVSATRHNRQVVREHRTALATALPLDSREVLAALRAGEVPRANGIAFVRPASWDRPSLRH